MRMCRGRGGKSTYLDSLRELKSPGVLPRATFADGVAMLFMLIGRLGFSGDGESAIMGVKSYIILLNARQLEECSDNVFLCVFVKIHPRK